MADNPYVNKVEYGGNVLIDLTADTVDAAHLAQGYTAHDASGAAITGTLEVTEMGSYWATCSTAASTAAKAITVSGWTPASGDVLTVLFSAANTAGVPTLAVNGTSYAIRIGSTAPSATTNVLKWSANTVLLFVYDGTYFRYIASMAAASSIPPDGAGSWYGTCSTAAGTAAKTSTIANFRLMPGAVVHLACSTANTKVDAALTLNINATGAKTIYVDGAATSSTNTLTWAAGDVLTFVYSGSYWYYAGGATALAKVASGSFVQLVTATSNQLSQSDWNTTLTATIPDGYSFVSWVMPRTNGWVGTAYVGSYSVSGSVASANLYWNSGGSGTVAADMLCVWKG